MKLGLATAAAIILLAGGLSACGGGGSEFKSKVVEQCNKDGGKIDDITVDCGCAADVLDANMDADTKKFMLAALKAKDSAGDDPAKAAQAMKDAGVDPTNPDTMKKMQDMMSKMSDLDTKVKDKCKKA